MRKEAIDSHILGGPAVGRVETAFPTATESLAHEHGRRGLPQAFG